MRDRRKRGHGSSTVDAIAQSTEAKIQAALVSVVQKQNLATKQDEEREVLHQLVPEPSQHAAVLEQYEKDLKKLEGTGTIHDRHVVSYV